VSVKKATNVNVQSPTFDNLTLTVENRFVKIVGLEDIVLQNKTPSSVFANPDGKEPTVMKRTALRW